MKSWEKLPQFMQVEEVRPYYEILQRHKGSLLLKRFFDIIMAGALLIVLSPVFFDIGFFYKS